jgi:hypothetical protein
MDRRNSKTSNNNNINDEVDKIFKKHKSGLTQKEFMDLRNQYGDVDFADKVQKAYINEDNRVTKKAKKVVRIMKEKYGEKQLPFHYLLEKAAQFKRKYNFSDAVFTRFQEIFEQELIGSKSKEVIIPSTKMMKILGYLDLDYSKNSNKSLSDADARSIQEIIKLNSNPMFRDKQRQALMQSLTYKKFGILGEYKPELGDSTSGPLVHPVIAALFVNKIDIIDKHFLYSNLANIVDCRYNNKPLEYITDIKLFNALVRDPNDILCNSHSPYTDLLARVKIQHCLWENVINFREGRYYRVPAFNMLLQELENCDLLSNGEKSLMYGNSDGTILKRLLNAFSFRPTVIYHMPKEMDTRVVFNSNPYQQIIRPIVSNTTLIHLKPPMQLDRSLPSPKITLTEALRQTQLIIEHGKMVLKETHVTYSNGVLFFYVDRRLSKMHPTRLAGTTFSNIELNFSSGIPYSVINSYDTINDIEVIVQDFININNHTYILKSVVCAETLPLHDKEVIINSSTIFTLNKDLAQGGLRKDWYRYDPIGLNNLNTSSEHVTTGINIPLSQINYDRSINNEIGTDYLLKNRGIIYVYGLMSDDGSTHSMAFP